MILDLSTACFIRSYLFRSFNRFTAIHFVYTQTCFSKKKQYTIEDFYNCTMWIMVNTKVIH